MKIERNIFIFIFAFFAIVTPVYWIMSHDWAGVFVLGFSAALGAMVAFYLGLKGREYSNRPSDREDGEIVDSAGDVAFFPPQSIWPFWGALMVALVFLGPATHQPWITLLGLGLGIWATAGWTLEFYRGDYRH